jgi:hypothetical protein
MTRYKYKILFVVLFQILVSAEMATASSAPTFNNITIVVSSCDKYAELWDPFFTFLFKNWPSLLTQNAHIPIILISGYKDYHDSKGRVTIHYTDQDTDWSAGMINVLKEVKTDYVLYLQEDYIIHQPVNEERLHQLFTNMEKEGVAYLEISPDKYFLNDPKHTHLPGVALKRKHDEHRTSLQAALWRKDALRWLIKLRENPWEFERDGSIRSQGMMQPFWVVIDDYPLVYLNACNGGYWDHEVLKYIQDQGINVSARKLPIDKEHPFLRWLQQGYPVTYRRLMRLREWF